jgi:hypothetical protein
MRRRADPGRKVLGDRYVDIGERSFDRRYSEFVHEGVHDRDQGEC